jgi:hypothetical protein
MLYRMKENQKMYTDTKQMMADAKFYESYSRYDDISGRYETWDEAVDRVMNMHKNFYEKKLSPKLQKYFDIASAAYKNKKMLGAQRALQFGGDQLLKHHMKNYNCCTTYIDRAAVFGEYFYVLLCGAGVGFSAQKHHVEKIPSIINRTKAPKIHVVEDSIEGWATAIDVLMSSYFEDNGKYPEFKGHRVYFDLSKIRPKGAKISGGFKAPGPDSLRLALDRIEYIIQGSVINSKKAKLRPIQVYDILMHIADAVLAGGVRRSATICIFSFDDEEMLNAKTGNWFTENPQRARSNNSAMIIRDTIKLDEFMSIMEKIKGFGEPGFIFSDSTEHCFNPCVVGETRILTKNGYRPIIELVGENVEIWNGMEWSVVSPFYTGKKMVYEVQFSNGISLKCTANHKFVLKGGERKELKDMVVGDKLEKYKMPVIDSGVEYDVDAYSQGFESGDRIKNVPYFEKNWVPHDASLNYKLNWLSGLMDANGIRLWEESSCLLQLTSNNVNFLKEIRLMLTTMGVQATVSKLHLYSNAYKLIINPYDVLSLKNLGIKFNLLDITDNVPINNEAEHITLVGVKEIGEDDVFCFTEEKNNTGTFEGIVTGQCVEISMLPIDIETGKSGWEGCNLTEINGGLCDNEDTFYEACEAASILGTLQAGYTDFKFLDETSKKIFDREALLGVSITGWMSNPDILFDEEIMRKGAKIVLDTNEAVAKLIGINPAARATCVKPSGNASVLLQTPSGIHPDHSPMYLRHIQMNKNTDIAQLIMKYNPYMVEESVWSTSKSDYVIAFPVVAKKGSLYKNDLMGVKHLEYIKKAQMNWIEYGTRPELSTDHRLRHNVSNTIQVDDWEEVGNYLFENRHNFAGVSLIPATGDKIYNQAPNTKVMTLDELNTEYGVASVFASGLIVDGLKVFDNLWDACMSAKQSPFIPIGTDNDSNVKADWIRRFHKFSDNYFNGDKDKTEYCLKDVYNLHKWEKIQQNLTSIDFIKELKEKEFVDINTLAAAACAGVTENGEAACFI